VDKTFYLEPLECVFCSCFLFGKDVSQWHAQDSILVVWLPIFHIYLFRNYVDLVYGSAETCL
jgi:TM2 domain-containing membrane protein YozV